MPVTFGAITYGKTAPAGYLQESSEETTCEVATIRDETGKTLVHHQKPRSYTTTTLKTKGELGYMTVAAAGTNFSGATITSSKVGETNDDFATAEVVYTTHQ